MRRPIKHLMGAFHRDYGDTQITEPIEQAVQRTLAFVASSQMHRLLWLSCHRFLFHLATLIMPFLVLHSGESVVGGEYHITSEIPSEGDMNFFFAQAKVDDDVRVDGHIFLYSSTLDLSGHVTEDIHAFESDLTLRESAHVAGQIDKNELIHWMLLLPAIAQIP